ncbi:Single-stranded DNA binding protein [Natronobacterium gregoryi]|uniref:Replication factor A n=2 Tax=Natronobacterium gregoryi TaxID=44930 RepID=L0AEJ6_NATGS|nr:Single-stranded DNA binding protein [Natronobacterium gregoryi]AFZ71854.1 single-stranded DNA-binding protein [Natronobacterium gregoryi SP2]ELY73076.1 replication factor A [Natronobacterium gregoryi SP2]PLK19371.1 replication factor A [Natronobacterium gregoryi SP2]SFJ50374.1 replication factor A1 [Natronobacterium gregoryi]
MQLEDHAEELASDLGVDKEEVTSDLQNLVEYSVPIDEAKRSLRRKYGDGSTGGGDAPSSKDVADVAPEDGNVTVTGVVLTAGKRSIRYQGDDHVIVEGRLADETGVIDYTSWEDFGLSPGDTITAGNASVREWDGEPELNLGESTSLSVEEESLEVPYGIGGKADLADLQTGDRAADIEVAVLECERRTIDGRDGETEILSGVFGDESGRLPFTNWEPAPEIEERNTVRIENAYVQEFRGVPEVNVSEFSTVTDLEREIDVGADTSTMDVGEAVRTGGIYDVCVVGNVIAVRDGSGLIQRCPECYRVIQKGQCRTHGDVDGIDDLRVKAIVDDGTGTLTAVLDDELTEQVYGGTLEDALEQAREAMDQEVVADRIRERIVGREYCVRGHLSVDEYGANLDAETFEESDDDPEARAQEFLETVDVDPTEREKTEVDA